MSDQDTGRTTAAVRIDTHEKPPLERIADALEALVEIHREGGEQDAERHAAALRQFQEQFAALMRSNEEAMQEARERMERMERAQGIGPPLRPEG